MEENQQAVGKRHELKTWEREFRAVLEGQKRHEIRINDRDFRPGDTVVLKEWETRGIGYTGFETAFTIGHVTKGPSWGLPDDLCVFTLLEITKPPGGLDGGS